MNTLFLVALFLLCASCVATAHQSSAIQITHGAILQPVESPVCSRQFDDTVSRTTDSNPARPQIENLSTPSLDTVILLHGLGRTSLSMKRVEWHLRSRGYHVINARFPTWRLSVAQISEDYLAPILQLETNRSAARIHFVTHSQGGIVLRQYLANHQIPNLGRVIMLAPPNHGSEISDRLKANPVTRRFLGPGYLELGTAPDSLPNRLGPIQFDCGVIAGDRSLNPLLSSFLSGPNDGKVTVASARAAGLHDFLVVHNSHTWLMWRQSVLRQIDAYLASGHFDHPAIASE